jgi:hypothetical protein
VLAEEGTYVALPSVEVEEIRTVDRDIPPGLWPDMREHGYDSDEFPDIYERLVVPAHILIIAGPVWLGDQSSLTRKIIERLYAYSSDVNDAGQWSYYGKIGAAITTGNDDGGKHVSAQVLYALQHSVSPSHPSRTPTGPERPVLGPPTSMPSGVASTTHGRPATQSSSPGTCCILRAWSPTLAASRRTGTRRTTGNWETPSTPTPSTDRRGSSAPATDRRSAEPGSLVLDLAALPAVTRTAQQDRADHNCGERHDTQHALSAVRRCLVQ